MNSYSYTAKLSAEMSNRDHEGVYSLALYMAGLLDKLLGEETENDEPLRELCFDYRNASTAQAEECFQLIVRWAKRHSATGQRVAVQQGEKP